MIINDNYTRLTRAVVGVQSWRLPWTLCHIRWVTRDMSTCVGVTKRDMLSNNM